MKNKKIKTNKQTRQWNCFVSILFLTSVFKAPLPTSSEKAALPFPAKLSPGCVCSTPCTGMGWGLTPVAGALRSGFGVLSSVPGLPPAQTCPDFWQWARGLLWELCWAVPRPLTQPSLPSTLHSLPKSKGENPQIRLTVELSLPFLRTTAKLTHRWFFLASLFFDDVFSMLSIKLKYCLPGITAHQVLYYRWN